MVRVVMQRCLYADPAYIATPPVISRDVYHWPTYRYLLASFHPRLLSSLASNSQKYHEKITQNIVDVHIPMICQRVSEDIDGRRRHGGWRGPSRGSAGGGKTPSSPL